MVKKITKKITPNQNEKSLNLISAVGEYYVCAELCKLGYLSLLTPKNNPLFDVIVTDAKGSKSVSIQVKTRSIDNKQGWILGIDVTKKKNNPKLFMVLVNLLDNKEPEYYIYEYDLFANKIKSVYNKYISTPKRDGSTKKEVSFRWLDEKDFNSADLKRKNNWSSILNALK